MPHKIFVMKILSFHVKTIAKFEERVPVHSLKNQKWRFSQINYEDKTRHDSI